ncbi:MAG: DUF4831 family protein [Bacteroidia bacterium]|nr:MAG: DUF4831 family protein [Bacteroidia bacterium]
MQRIIFPALLIIAFLLSACKSQQPFITTTAHVSLAETGTSGVMAYYALPRTVVAVDVEVLKTTRVPGPYARYAEQYLGLDGVILEPSHQYAIKSVSFNHFAEPDPEHIYQVSFPAGEQQGLFITLNEAGIIYAVSTGLVESEHTTFRAEGKDYGFFGPETTFNYFLTSSMTERVDTIIEDVRLDTITIQRQRLRRSWVEKSPAQRAAELAELIFEIREKKFDLISGFQEIDYSSEALRYMYTEMDKLETDYLNLFTGITHTHSQKLRFYHRPVKHDVQEMHTLFYFSSDEGVSHQAANDSKPVRLAYDRSGAADLLGQQLNRPVDPRRKTPAGFHYRIPEYAEIVLLVGEEKRAEYRMLINQFGIVTHLPADQLEIQFHPTTGSIRSVGRRSEPGVSK